MITTSAPSTVLSINLVNSDPRQGIVCQGGTEGVVFKGPFARGGRILAHGLTAEGVPTGVVTCGRIASDDGRFDVPLPASDVVLLEASGLYYNESTARRSDRPLTLRAVTDRVDAHRLRIDTFTHLMADRIGVLLARGCRFIEAERAARNELAAACGMALDAEGLLRIGTVTTSVGEARVQGLLDSMAREVGRIGRLWGPHARFLAASLGRVDVGRVGEALDRYLEREEVVSTRP